LQQRAIATGRIVPRELLEEAMIQVPRSVQILSPLVDYYAEIDNPQTSDDVFLIKPEGSTWEEFKKQWIQYVFSMDDGTVADSCWYSLLLAHPIYHLFSLLLLVRTVAYIPSRRKLLEKAEKAKLRLESKGTSSISDS
jgi:hypothetical protein